MVGNSALLPSDVKNFPVMPTQRFWLKTVSLLDAIALKGNNKNTRCWEKISCYITKYAIYLIFLSTLIKTDNFGTSTLCPCSKGVRIIGNQQKGKKKGRDHV